MPRPARRGPSTCGVRGGLPSGSPECPARARVSAVRGEEALASWCVAAAAAVHVPGDNRALAPYGLDDQMTTGDRAVPDSPAARPAPVGV